MFDVGRLKDGDTVLISGAAGSVGLVSPTPPHYLRHQPIGGANDPDRMSNRISPPKM